MVKPIRADEVDSTAPDEVIEEFNAMLKMKWNGRVAVIYSKEIAEKVATRMNLTVSDVLKRNLLDIEIVYRECGWQVEFIKPDYNDPHGHAAYFEFKKKKEQR